VLLSQDKNKKKEKENVKVFQKTTTAPKNRKRGAKEEQYLEEHIKKA
jgi:hypothetical protein